MMFLAYAYSARISKQGNCNSTRNRDWVPATICARVAWTLCSLRYWMILDDIFGKGGYHSLLNYCMRSGGDDRYCACSFLLLVQKKRTKEKDSFCPTAPQDKLLALRCYRSSLFNCMCWFVVSTEVLFGYINCISISFCSFFINHMTTTKGTPWARLILSCQNLTSDISIL